MEITTAEIKKISKKYKIPEKDIIYFLAEEERLIRLEDRKKQFFEKGSICQKTMRINFLRLWQNECKKFSEFEELYVNAEIYELGENFFFDWLKSTENYAEKKEIYSCVTKELDESIRKKFVKTWIDHATSLEDIREAMSHADNDSEDYKNGLQKIIKIYKS